MASIKVAPTIFSPVKTIERALKKATHGDDIQVAAGFYKESLHFRNNVSVIGRNVEESILEGIIFIPKDVTVTFKHMSFVPTASILVEGKAIFSHCQFDGCQTSVILSATGGDLQLTSCKLKNATSIGLTLFNDSTAHIHDTHFSHNHKAHLLLEQSHATVEKCTFAHAVHAIWLKSDSTLTSTSNHYHTQSGTQIILQQTSTFEDRASCIEKSEGNGICIKKASAVKLHDTTIRQHTLPQIWVQESTFEAAACTITNGKESGIMAYLGSSVELSNCTVAHHKLANIQVTDQSRLNVDDCMIHHCEGVGIQVRKESIANVSKTTFKYHTLSQLLIAEQAIMSIKDCLLTDGSHVGLSLEKNSNCTAVNTRIHKHKNTGVTLVESELVMIDSEIAHNEGNGLLALDYAHVQLDNAKFHANGMPHIAGKNHAHVTVLQSTFSNGKSFYLIEASKLHVTECKLFNSDGVQVEVTDQTTAVLKRCSIKDGRSNGIKALRNASITLEETTIAAHDMPQVVVNDSSIIVKDCEILDGERNGLIIENNSEAFIEQTFIARHRLPQIWIDLESNVELTEITLRDGTESDIYVQNKSNVQATKCIVHNEHFPYNIQAINYSSIKLNESIVDNQVGDSFYSENNSTIVHLVDEMNE